MRNNSNEKLKLGIFVITGLLLFGAAPKAIAQDAAKTEQVADATDAKTFHQELKQRFIEGGPFFMGIVLVALILGLAIAFTP